MCSAHFTRKFGAKRHNRTLHNNRGSYVSFLEYIIGRVSGKYSAGDPWVYRREKRKTQNLFGDNSRNDAVKLGSARDSTTDVFGCGTLAESIPKNNIDKQYSPLHPSFQSLHETADQNKQTMDGLHEFYEGIHILAEIKTLLSRHCSPEQVQSVIFGWSSYIFSAKNLEKLYNFRAWLLSQVNWKESLEKLSPIGQVPMISFDWLWRPTNNANFENKATSSFFNAFISQQQSCRGNFHSALSKSIPTSDENKSSQKDSSYSIPEIPTVPEIPL